GPSWTRCRTRPARPLPTHLVRPGARGCPYLHSVEQHPARAAYTCPVPERCATRLPLRADLVGEQPYGAPQLDVPHLLNVNENPYPPPAEVTEDIAAAVRAASRTLNRYPDREFLDLRADLADYLSTESAATGLAAERVAAADGSNEVMLHVLLACGGPGRVAMAFAPTSSMYPEYARDSLTTWMAGTRRADFTVDVAG